MDATAADPPGDPALHRSQVQRLLQILKTIAEWVQRSMQEYRDRHLVNGQLAICNDLTFLEMQVPRYWDVVGQCDGCGHIRHLFFGYAQQNSLADLEPVIALCQPCGGTARNRDVDDDEMSHAG